MAQRELALTRRGPTVSPASDVEMAVVGDSSVSDERRARPSGGDRSSPSPSSAERALGDFTTTPAILRLVPLAIVIGAFGAGISLALLDMIGFFTNLFYYQRLSVTWCHPNANTLGAIALVIPVGGGLIVGLMARFGSEQIRGHGIPEAMERILINGSRVPPPGRPEADLQRRSASAPAARSVRKDRSS